MRLLPYCVVFHDFMEAGIEQGDVGKTEKNESNRKSKLLLQPHANPDQVIHLHTCFAASSGQHSTRRQGTVLTIQCNSTFRRALLGFNAI